MLIAETYTIEYNELVKHSQPKELGRILLDRWCVCGHVAYFHNYKSMNNLNRMCHEYTFLNCTKLCKCVMFRRDNLRYLESLLDE